MRRSAYVLLAAHWVMAGYWYTRLPERIPIHFNLRGQADRWTSDPAGIWFLLPVVSTLLLLLFFGVSRLAKNVPQLWNIPEKKKFLALTPEQRAPIVDRLLGIMDSAALYAVGLLLYVHSAMYASAVSGHARLGWLFHVLVWGGLVVLLAYSFRLTGEVRQMILRASRPAEDGSRY